MPKSSRDLTSKERKDKLAASIAANGFVVLTKCYHCTQANVLCQVDLRSGRCVECARLGQSCNRQTTRINFENIRRRREKIARELDDAEAVEDDLTRKLLGHRARVRRLRHQLRTKEELESQAQDCEADSISKTICLEEEFRDSLAGTTPFDPQLFEEAPIDDTTCLSKELLLVDSVEPISLKLLSLESCL